MSKIIVGERLEKELGNLVKIVEEELQSMHDRVYDFLEDWEMGDNLAGDSVPLETIMEMVVEDLKYIIHDLIKTEMQNGITPEQVKVAVRLAVENWFKDKLKISLEMIK